MPGRLSQRHLRHQDIRPGGEVEPLENGCTSLDTHRPGRRARKANCGAPYAVGAGRTRGPLNTLHATRAVNAGRTLRPLKAIRAVDAGRPHGPLRAGRALCSGCSGLVPLERGLARGALARVVDDPNSTVGRVVAAVNDAVRVGNLSESDGSRERPRQQDDAKEGNS